MKQLFVKKLLPEVRKEFLGKCVWTGNMTGESLLQTVYYSDAQLDGLKVLLAMVLTPAVASLKGHFAQTVLFVMVFPAVNAPLKFIPNLSGCVFVRIIVLFVSVLFLAAVVPEFMFIPQPLPLE